VQSDPDVSRVVKVVPAPRYAQWAVGAPFWLDVRSLERFVVPKNCQDVEAGVAQVNARLGELGLNPLPVSEEPGRKVIQLAVEPCAELEKLMAHLFRPEAEGYRFLIDEDTVFILGRDLPGLFYGLMTLTQLIDDEGFIPGVAISDWPDLSFRGTHLYYDYAGAIELIPQFARLKLNTVLYQSTLYYHLSDPDDPLYPEAVAQLQSIHDLCQRQFIDLVPLLISFGHGGDIMRLNPNIAEGISVRQHFQVKDWQVQSPDVVTPDLNVINPGFESYSNHNAKGWSQEHPGVTSFIDTEDPHAGGACLRMTCDAGQVFVYQDVDCLPGKKYDGTCYLKTENIVGGGAYVVVHGITKDDRSEGLVARSSKTRGARDWQAITFSFSSQDYQRLRIYLCLEGQTGSAWFDDVEIKGVQGPNDLDNVMITKAAPLVVQDETGAITYLEGRDYEYDNSLLYYPYQVGNRLHITIKPEGKINDGDTLLLSYTRAALTTGAYIDTCCPSEPAYYEIMRSAIQSSIKHLEPKYIHVGHDELSVLNRDRRCTERHVENRELFAFEVEKLLSFVQEADPKTRMMMWGDSMSPFHDPEHIWNPDLGLANAAELIPRQVIVCIWWYDWPDTQNRIENTLTYYLNLGFDVTGSPWYDPNNAYQWAASLYNHAQDNSQVLGAIYTCWPVGGITQWGALKTLAEYTWTVHQPPFLPATE
jgi:hypothetical protein